MTKRCALYFPIVVLSMLFISTVASFAGLNTSATQDTYSSLFADDPQLKDLANYRKWTRVTDQPLRSNSFQLDGG